MSVWQQQNQLELDFGELGSTRRNPSSETFILLGIPTVLERLIQQATAQVLTVIWESTFSEYSFGFRPRRSQHEAIRQGKRYGESGDRYVVELDLEKFFDRVNHDRLMSRVATRVHDKRVLKLIRRFL